MYDDDDEGPSAEDIERFGDATRKCPDCGREVYDEVEICPHCGHAFSHGPSRTPVWVTIVVIIVIIAFVLFFVL